MASKYSEIKKICLIEFQIMSQVVLSKNLRDKNRSLQSVHTKILLQILAKSGFTLWCPSLSKELDPVMLVSFDMKKYGTSKKIKIIGIGSMNK